MKDKFHEEENPFNDDKKDKLEKQKTHDDGK